MGSGVHMASPTVVEDSTERNGDIPTAEGRRHKLGSMSCFSAYNSFRTVPQTVVANSRACSRAVAHTRSLSDSPAA